MVFISLISLKNPEESNLYQKVSAHADWLKGRMEPWQSVQETGIYLNYTWICPDNFQKTQGQGCHHGNSFRVFTSPWQSAEGYQEVDRLYDADSTILEFQKDTGKLAVWVPHTTPEPLFWLQTEETLVCTTDLRLAMRMVKFEVDPRGMFSLLELGSIPAPWTTVKSIHRVRPGHVTEWHNPTSLPAHKICTVPIETWQKRNRRVSAEQIVLEAIDALVVNAPESTILYFSGGVDSTLIATRLVELSRRDIRMVHYSFGKHDIETEVAKKIADSLGLPLEIIVETSGDMQTVLDTIGTDYTFPSGDFSVIPTNMLIRRSLDELGPFPAAFEGTGADGAFGVGTTAEQWNLVFKIPKAIRRILADLSSMSKLDPWKFNPYAATLQRVTRRSVDFPDAFAVVGGQNTLRGVAYDVPEDIQDEIVRALKVGIEGVVKDRPLNDRASWVDLIHICAGQYAQKSHDVLRSSGVRPIFPFLEPKLLKAAYSVPWAQKSRKDNKKSLLKAIVARSVPEDCVYRAKSGFMPPLQQYLNRAGIGMYEELLYDPGANPLLDYVNKAIVHRIYNYACHSERKLPTNVLSFLWMVIFYGIWHQQISACIDKTK